MSESPSRQSEADVERELGQIAYELYALLPESFTAARDDEVRKARAQGQQQLARALTQLRRPTQSAWVVNLLWRDQRQVIEDFLQLAEDLSHAQAQGSVEEFRRLTARRRELEAGLISRGHKLAEQAEVVLTTSIEREVRDTLAAALASTDVATEVRSGRLVKAASYGGFGPDTFVVPVPRAERPIKPERKVPTSSPRRKIDDIRARADQHARERREGAERRASEARAALEAAADTLADRSREAEAAKRHHGEALKGLEDLRARLLVVEEKATAAEQAARAAAQSRDLAEKEKEEALRTLARAEQDLVKLVGS
ncbi:MAG: uncharacterized protein HW416_11 [Chloroflexi bacterium]|nr:uncharacterized protein [Chloroflexota bacterium]